VVIDAINKARNLPMLVNASLFFFARRHSASRYSCNNLTVLTIHKSFFECENIVEQLQTEPICWIQNIEQLTMCGY
jgi:glycosylphosphatidylinositol transamidase (GPIT) subunit GPI8